jgi:hypothetical protein
MSMTLKKGEELVVCIGDWTYTGMVVQDATIEAIGDLDIYRGECNEVLSIYLSGAGTRISISGMFTAAPTMAIGDEITVNTIAGIVEKFDIKYSQKEAIASFTIVAYNDLAGA